jgi:hypothetical protein
MDFTPMIDRRALAVLLLGGAAGLSACASGGEPSAPEDVPDMLFISPMGEPFRAKPPAPYPVDLWFKGADKDGDGKLTLAEFLADAERFFHILDINKDGVIDHREIFFYEHRTVPEMLGQAYGALRRRSAGEAKLWLAQYGGGITGPQHQPQGPEEPHPPEGKLQDDKPLIGAAAYGLLADPEPVQGCDIRITGIITLSDFKTRGQQRFKLLDFDNKGYLTLAGLPETEAQKLAPHPKHGRGGPRRQA